MEIRSIDRSKFNLNRPLGQTASFHWRENYSFVLQLFGLGAWTSGMIGSFFLVCFYSLFVKDVRNGRLGRYTLDRVGEIDAND